jgi:hypothetical protein
MHMIPYFTPHNVNRNVKEVMTRNLKLLQTLPDLRRCKVRRTSNFAQVGFQYPYGQIYIYMYTQGRPFKNPNSKTLQHDLSQHDRPVVRLLAIGAGRLYSQEIPLVLLLLQAELTPGLSH